ncbi:MAG: hypothetical protein IBJ09_10465 [Bacteroidia bacterium]|nr:hypothetical protein [Bacteroidia bacterium]
MGLFSLFAKPRPANTDNKIAGPTFLEGITAHIDQPKNLHPREWRRKLRTAEGNEWFRIWFYGHQLNGRDPLVVATDAAPVLMYAEDVETGRHILLFDGARHGYSVLFGPSFARDQAEESRPLTHCFSDGYGNNAFRVTLSALYSVDHEMVFPISTGTRNPALKEGRTELNAMKRNAFGAFHVSLINKNGESITVLSEELV